jgi:hypothetical protein
MSRRRVGEDRGSKEMDGCPLTGSRNGNERGGNEDKGSRNEDKGSRNEDKGSGSEDGSFGAMDGDAMVESGADHFPFYYAFLFSPLIRFFSFLLYFTMYCVFILGISYRVPCFLAKRNKSD